MYLSVTLLLLNRKILRIHIFFKVIFIDLSSSSCSLFAVFYISFSGGFGGVQTYFTHTFFNYSPQVTICVISHRQSIAVSQRHHATVTLTYSNSIIHLFKAVEVSISFNHKNFEMKGFLVHRNRLRYVHTCICQLDISTHTSVFVILKIT